LELLIVIYYNMDYHSDLHKSILSIVLCVFFFLSTGTIFGDILARILFFYCAFKCEK
jgi:hypothetical protein